MWRLLIVTCGHGKTAPQETQLSQTSRLMLRVIEYFAKSPKVSEGHSK